MNVRDKSELKNPPLLILHAMSALTNAYMSAAPKTIPFSSAEIIHNVLGHIAPNHPNYLVASLNNLRRAVVDQNVCFP